MSSLKSSKAIGAVTELIFKKLNEMYSQVTTPDDDGSPVVVVELGFPREAPDAKMYLLLYEIEFDPSLKNVPLDEGQPAPIWLVLKYLLTAYSSDELYEKYEAYENIGKAIQTLQRLNYLDHEALSSYEALKGNPEPLKITFDKAPLDVISKILGTVNEKYQCSVCFQIRPVMITLDAMPSYSLLVGVDYTRGEIIGEEGVLPTVEIMGVPIIEEIRLIELENNEEKEIRTSRIEFDSNTEKRVLILGSKLDNPNLRVRLDSQLFDTVSASSSYTRLEWKVDVDEVSAGSFPLSLVETKTENGEVSINSVSNVKIIHFVPYLTKADLHPDKIILSGTLLGSKEDAVVVAFYEEGTEGKKGKIVNVYNSFLDDDYSVDQRNLTIRLSELPEEFSGTYRLILRVNSQQARKSPEVEIPS